MKIQTIELQNVGGIQHLKLENIDRQMNIICGENGVGKTTLIDSIGHIFTNQHTNVLKKNVQSERATIKSNIEPYRVCRRVNILRDYPDDKIKIYP